MMNSFYTLKYKLKCKHYQKVKINAQIQVHVLYKDNLLKTLFIAKSVNDWFLKKKKRLEILQ